MKWKCPWEIPQNCAKVQNLGKCTYGTYFPPLRAEENVNCLFVTLQLKTVIMAPSTGHQCNITKYCAVGVKKICGSLSLSN